jgi:hypothetical protein
MSNIPISRLHLTFCILHNMSGLVCVSVRLGELCLYRISLGPAKMQRFIFSLRVRVVQVFKTSLLQHSSNKHVHNNRDLIPFLLAEVLFLLY